ncbi:HNH endonuclease [Flavobacterium sharifuzzamanii]|uniref:HNH endonuclease n=1 Tax=Flavobacterium sharifuzzamanii TaxID=2211133 RepID=UPI000DACFE8C|nr:HNH endonuclease [Flavobacterium sharifuzzamanii]KAF2082011.1 HNH endonuclease [Flavobacterium sharifuzzamanii]
MYTFIDVTPAHRADAPVYAKYTQYKKILKEDFKRRCAYCHDLDNYRIRSFAIDHFVPRKPINFVTTIPPNKYENLIYSCSYCNRAKWNKWPTDKEDEENNGSIGFIKPTNTAYKDLFFRNPNGRIIPVANNILAVHIKDELLLWHPIHSLMWRIEKLMKLEEKVRSKLQAINNDELNAIHHRITTEITDIARMIFHTND